MESYCVLHIAVNRKLQVAGCKLQVNVKIYASESHNGSGVFNTWF